MEKNAPNMEIIWKFKTGGLHRPEKEHHSGNIQGLFASSFLLII
jgi:hypothetical protein